MLYMFFAKLLDLLWTVHALYTEAFYPLMSLIRKLAEQLSYSIKLRFDMPPIWPIAYMFLKGDIS
jgi:hypothetical protein